MMSRYGIPGFTIMMSAPSASSASASRSASRQFAGSCWYVRLLGGMTRPSWPGRGALASASRKGP